MALQLRANLDEKQQQVDKLTAEYNAVKEKHTSLQTAQNSAEELLQTLLTGLSSNKGDGNTGGGYMGQIADAEKRMTEAKAEESQFTTKLEMKQAALKELQAKHKQVADEVRDSARNLEALKTTVENFKRKVAETGWSEEKEQAHETALREAKHKVRNLTEVCLFLLIWSGSD